MASSIVTVTALASKHFEAPEWEFDKDEADGIGKAMQDVTELYTDVKLPAELIAWGNLALLVATAVGPRLYMTTERLKKERMRDVTPTAANSGAQFKAPTTNGATPGGPNTPAANSGAQFQGPPSPGFSIFDNPGQEKQVDLRPQAPQPPTGAELNKALFPDEFKF